MAQQDDSISGKISKAKGVLATAKAKFPSPKPVPNAPVIQNSKPVAPPAASPMAGVNSRAGNIAANRDILSPGDTALPKLHNGGPVLTDGAYQLKAGEHVLTAAEAKKARKHALMAVGMKSLANPGKSSPITSDPSPSKKSSKGVSIRRPNLVEDQDAPIKLKQ
jgi:hypothetical protein